MPGLFKILRWYFGIEALLLFTLPAVAIWNNPPAALLRSRAIPFTELIRISVVLASFGGVVLVLATVCGMAWWTLPKGKTSSQAWAIATSALNVPLVFACRPMWLSTAAGITGLWVFSQRQTFARIALSAAKIPRLPRDGTSRILDMMTELAMCGGVLATWSWWSRWAQVHSLPMVEGWPLLLALIGASLISTTIHELGHVVAGWALGMKLRAFIAGPFRWRYRSGRWDFEFHPTGLLLSAGAAGLVPSSPQDRRWRDIAVPAAGPLASLLLGALALWATLGATGGPWEQAWEFLALVATCSLLTFVINLIPIRPEGSYSDGARIYQLLSGGAWMDLNRAFSITACSLACRDGGGLTTSE